MGGGGESCKGDLKKEEIGRGGGALIREGGLFGIMAKGVGAH